MTASPLSSFNFATTPRLVFDDGASERLLANSFHVEGPPWAPNGRAIMYFTQSPTGENGAQVVRLAAVDLTGQHGWQVSTPLDGSDPAWSPLLP